jgi:hypothetical protein
MTPRPLWWVVIEHEHTHRDTFIGPFHTLERANISMQDSAYVQGLCEEDCIDCFTTDVQPDQDLHEVLIINPFEPHFTGEPDPEDDEPGPGLTLIEVPVRDRDVSPANTEGEVPMRTFLVAVVAPSEADVMAFLTASRLAPGVGDSAIDCWWIAEDDRHDGSDNDSAIFIPRGAQQDMAHVVRNHLDAHAEAWREDGYPYAGTDVSGVWFRDRS